MGVLWAIYLKFTKDEAEMEIKLAPLDPHFKTRGTTLTDNSSPREG